MNIKKILLVSFGVILVMGATAGVTLLSLHLFMHGDRHRGGSFGAAHEMFHRLDLSKEQKKQLEPHETQLKEELDELQIQMAKKRISVCRLLNSSSSNTETIMTSVNEISDLQTKQQKLVVQHLLAIRDILTPDQRDKFFTAIMTDVCRKCRAQLCLTKKDCLCGKCAINLNATVEAKKEG